MVQISGVEKEQLLTGMGVFHGCPPGDCLVMFFQPQTEQVRLVCDYLHGDSLTSIVKSSRASCLWLEIIRLKIYEKRERIGLELR